MHKNLILLTFVAVLSGCVTKNGLHLYEGDKRSEKDIAKVSMAGGGGFVHVRKVNGYSLSIFEQDIPFVYVLPGENSFWIQYNTLTGSTAKVREDVYLEAGHTYVFNFTKPSYDEIRFFLFDYGKNFPETCHLEALYFGGANSEKFRACIEKYSQIP